MSQKWPAVVGVLGILVLASLLLSLASCARDQQLVAITIQPAAATFLSPNASGLIQFSAIGSYIHPPVSKDITAEVTWKADIPGLVNVVAGAVTTNGGGCGITNISASTTKGTGNGGGLIIAYATVTVDDVTVVNCPGGSASLGVVQVALSGSGTVVSAPAGINCPTGNCGAQFPIGSPVVLNATPGTGATSVAWTGNCTASGNTCSLVVTSTPSIVTAVFN
jgi:hypothetical protein